MQKHISVLGILYIVLSLLGILGAGITFVILIGSGLISGDPEAITILSIIGGVISGFILLVSIPGLVGGIGLLRGYSWARILTLVLGFLNLLNIPFGTALGIYTIWVLFQEETIQIFQQTQNG